jgi:hypothetical protein
MNKKAQITLEACLLIVIVVTALLTMHGYLKRAIQGNWRTNVDAFSDEQYEKGVSSERVSGLTFVSPTMSVTFNQGKTIARTYNLSSNLGILQIDGWGTYKDGRGHDYDED